MADRSGVHATRRVAFLRAINVGGTGTIKMDELRRLAGAAGFAGVTTLGASGNVLYSSRRPAAVDARRLTEIIVRRMGRGTVVVHEAAHMAELVRTAPFTKPDPAVPDKWRFVALLERPTRAPLPELPLGSPVRYVGRAPREIFYTMSQPSRHAIAIAGRLERSLGTSLTVRNWNVIRTVTAKLSAPPAGWAGAARTDRGRSA